MLRTSTAMLAALALSAQGALAGPLGGPLTASETGEKAQQNRGAGSFFSGLLSSVRFSYDALRDATSYYAGEEYSSGECEGATAEGEETSEATEAKDEEHARPEPLYFGF
jgi:hypothetical protein